MKRKIKKGQAMIEFTFSMIVVLLMMFSMIMIFRWAGGDIAQRRISHEKTLICAGVEPIEQIDPIFHKPMKFRAVFDDTRDYEGREGTVCPEYSECELGCLFLCSFDYLFDDKEQCKKDCFAECPEEEE